MSKPSTTSSGNPALRFGALFGLGWGVLLILNYYLVQSQGVRFTTLAALILSLVIYLVAGLLAASQTGKTSTGLVAGLWAGLFSSLLNAVGVVILLLADHALLEKLRQAAQVAAARVGSPTAPITDQLFVISTVISLVVGMVVAAVVGLALGALGGALGKSRAPRAPSPQAYQESMYPGSLPAGGAPGVSSPPSPGSGSQP